MFSMSVQARWQFGALSPSDITVPRGKKGHVKPCKISSLQPLKCTISIFDVRWISDDRPCRARESVNN